MTPEQLLEDTARAYSAAWKKDIRDHIGTEVPSWDEMSERQRDAMRRCARAALPVALEAAAKVAEGYLHHADGDGEIYIARKIVDAILALIPKEPRL